MAAAAAAVARAQGVRLFHYFREKKPHLATCRCIVDASSKSSAVPFNHASMMNARANIIFDRGNV